MASIPRDPGQVTQPLQVWTQRGGESESFLSRKGPLPLGLSCVSWCETALCGGRTYMCVEAGVHEDKKQVHTLPEAATGMHTHMRKHTCSRRGLERKQWAGESPFHIALPKAPCASSPALGPPGPPQHTGLPGSSPTHSLTPVTGHSILTKHPSKEPHSLSTPGGLLSSVFCAPCPIRTDRLTRAPAHTPLHAYTLARRLADFSLL